MHSPTQARLVALCAAIAHAEGFWVPGARPRRNNNPGDLVGDGAIAGEFPTKLGGFDTLAWKVARILEGGSTVYPTALTFRELAEQWTGGDNAAAWSESVTDDLEVDPATSLAAWVQWTGPDPGQP